MNILSAIFCALALGMVAAIPVGATQLEVVRRSLKGSTRDARLLVAGGAAGDAAYGVIALFGLSHLVEHSWVTPVFRIVGGVIIVMLGVQAIRDARSVADALSDHAPMPATSRAFGLGLTLSLSNPLMVLWWLAGFKFAMDSGMFVADGPTVSAGFVAGGIIGAAGYLLFVHAVVHRLRSRVEIGNMRRIMRMCGGALIAFGAAIEVRALLM